MSHSRRPATEHGETRRAFHQAPGSRRGQTIGRPWLAGFGIRAYRVSSCAVRGGLEVVAALAREAVLRVDFDLIDDAGCSWISLRFHRNSTSAAPRTGDRVYLLDGKGGGCVGRVQQVEGWYVCVRPDWSTWTGGDLPPAGAVALGSRKRD